MSTVAQTPEETVLAQQLVQALGLEGVPPEKISPTAALFGSHSDGLGLDSIDALEIALMIQQHYGVELRSDDQQARAAFASLRALSSYVQERRKT